jgi:hypothetical protein
VANIGLASRAVFWIFYAVTLAVFARRKKTFENLLLFSLLGYLSFFTFNTGVSDNHLFLAFVLSVILAAFNARYAWLAFVLLVTTNLNLLLFAGGARRAIRLPNTVAEHNFTAEFAAFNVLLFLALWTCCLFLGPGEARTQQPVRPAR